MQKHHIMQLPRSINSFHRQKSRRDHAGIYGVGYIIGPKIAGVLVAGSVLSWLVFIPLLSTLVPSDMIAMQLAKLGYLADITKAGGKGGWDPVTHSFADYSAAIYYAYIRQVGAGAVTAGGIITLLKTIQPLLNQ